MIGGNLSSDTDQRNIQILKSRKVGEAFIVDQDLLPILFKERWDAENNTWHPADRSILDVILRREEKPAEPSMWHAFNRLEDRRTVQMDDMSGTVKISFKFEDPVLAMNVSSAFIDFVNSYIRSVDRENVDRNIEFLMGKLEDTPRSSLTQAIGEVAEIQLEKRMFIEARSDYAFEVIDDAFVPEEPSQPRRALALAVGIGGGLLIGLFAQLFIASLHEGQHA